VRDFNAFAGPSFNSFRDSGFDARGRRELFLQVASDHPITFPSGIIGDSVRFFAASGTLRWRMVMAGEPEDGWGRKSFTIRYWWRAGSGGVDPTIIPFFFRTAFDSMFYIQPNLNERLLDIPVGLFTSIYIPTVRFGVWTGAAYETVEHRFFQSPILATRPTGVPPGGIAGPLIEMSEDTWHRTIAWYDEDSLEIGLQLDDLPPETAALSGPIPTGPTQGLFAGETSPVGAPFNYGFDEYALWHDYVWTAPERAADWNSGAGTGWPDVLNAVSREPMAYWRIEDPADFTPSGFASMV
jgi:hypothetical protein